MNLNNDNNSILITVQIYFFRTSTQCTPNEYYSPVTVVVYVRSVLYLETKKTRPVYTILLLVCTITGYILVIPFIWLFYLRSICWLLSHWSISCSRLTHFPMIGLGKGRIWNRLHHVTSQRRHPYVPVL